ncbi:MAG: MarC family protein [Gemmatimonadota bacterium]|nr:MarC family protein [Gemmatimonadota bacterium]
MEPHQIFRTFAGLLAILNPLGAVPIFLGLTLHLGAPQRRRTARVAALAVAGVLVAAVWSGDALLAFFGVRIASFRVGGGILILLMAIAMLQARTSPSKQTQEEAEEAGTRDSVGVVPIGVPLLAGPGAISLVIVDAQEAAVTGRLVLTGLVLLVAGCAWLALLLADPIGRVLGRTGINIFTRLMGLLLAAVAVEYIATGFAGLFPVLAG